MPSGKIFVKHNFSAITGYLIIAVYENTSPSAELTSKRITIAGPHAERGDTIIGLNPVMHTLKFYQSTDGVTLETFLISMSIDASIYSQVLVEQFDYVVDRGDGDSSGSDIIWADPVTNDTQIIDDRLDGYTKDEIRFEMRGGLAYRQDEYDLVAGGGVELLGGATFGDTGNTYRITLFKQSQAQVTTSSSGEEWGIREVEDADFTAGSVDFDDTFYDKINVVNYSGTVGRIVFDDLELIPVMKTRFSTHGATQRYLILQFDTGDTVSFLDQQVNRIVLGKGELIELRSTGGTIYVTSYQGHADRVGRREFGDRLEMNTVYRDGTQYNQADFPRLMDWIDLLSPGQVVAEGTSAGQWSFQQTIGGEVVFPNKNKFARDNLNGKIRVPDDRDMFLRALDSVSGGTDTDRITQGPGGFMMDGIREHSHTVGHEGVNEPTFREGATHNVEVAAGVGAGNTTQSQKSSTGVVIRVVDDATNGVRAATETTGKNVGLLPLLYI